MWCPPCPPSPLPPQMKIVRDVGTSDLTWSRVPPIPQKWKLSEMLGQNVNLARLKNFGFELVQSTPSPLKIKTWPDWGTLDLSWSRVLGFTECQPIQLESRTNVCAIWVVDSYQTLGSVPYKWCLLDFSDFCQVKLNLIDTLTVTSTPGYCDRCLYKLAVLKLYRPVILYFNAELYSLN